MPVAEGGDFHVEPGIIDKNHDIGLPCGYVLPAEFHIAQQLEALCEHFRETHDRTVAVMAHQLGGHPALLGGRLHHVAAPETYPRPLVLCGQTAHEIAAVQVA